MTHEILEKQKKQYGSECIGNVIRIIDNRTLLVNIGKDVLQLGDKIQIYELGEMIKNFDGTDLCHYIYVKDEVEVIRTEFQYSICKKNKTVTKTKSIFTVSPLLEHEYTTYIPLNIDQSDIQELKPVEPLIKIGDPVKLAWQK